MVAPNASGPRLHLIRLSANFLSGALSGQRFLHPAFRARLQVVGVALDFLNDVFRLNFALESTQGVLDRLALLHSNFCQIHHPQTSTIVDTVSLQHFDNLGTHQCGAGIPARKG